MRRKIMEEQRRLERNNLDLELENNRSSAMYNKDLYNGVVHMVEDTRSRYEREVDAIEQENMAMSNLKKLFKNDGKEISESMELLKKNNKFVIIFNKYFGLIYKDLDGIYNLLAEDFINYYTRFYDKISKTQGVDRPAQIENIQDLEKGIIKLQEQQEIATDNIKDIVLENLDIANLNISKTHKGYLEKINELNNLYILTGNPDLRDEMDNLGLTDTYLTTKLPLLDDPNITIRERNEILEIVSKCKAPLMKKLLKKYSESRPSSPLTNPMAVSPTSMMTTTAPTTTPYKDEDVVDIEDETGYKNDYVIFGKYAYPLILTGASQGLYDDKPTYEFDENGIFTKIRSTKKIPPSPQVMTFNIPIFQKIAAAAAPPRPPSPPPKTTAPTITIPNDGEIITVGKTQFIIFDGQGHKLDASKITYLPKADLYFDGDGKPTKYKKTEGKWKRLTDNQKVIDYNTMLTTPTLTGVGLKKSVNTDKIMKILKKLQMKKITGGMNPQKFVSKAAADKFKSKGGMIQSDMGSKVKFIKQTIQARKK